MIIWLNRLFWGTGVIWWLTFGICIGLAIAVGILVRVEDYIDRRIE